MPPHHAIEEILYTGEFHPKLSPVQHPGAHGDKGTLQGLSEFWSGNHPQNLIPASGNTRQDLSVERWRSPERIWVRAAHTPGLNPVRQKIGLYLTNYHMAVNQEAGVNNHQVLVYYDELMNAVAADRPFEEVLTIAAASAAIAVQYNHRQNHFDGNTYRVNEDFAREYFQLFFGILSESTLADPQQAREHHEQITIPNMARLLTEMQPAERSGADSARMVFDRRKTGDASEVIKQSITGTNALERLQNLAPYAIQHLDSLKNLPVMIIQTLADDTLTDHPDRMDRIRAYWASLPEKNLMTFLKGYATSTDFHTADRIKYYTTFDRSLILANRMLTEVTEATGNRYNPQRLLNESSGFNAFIPLHDVFGSQTGKDAYNSSDFFLRTHRLHNNDWTTISNLMSEDKNWQNLLPQAAEDAFCLTSSNIAEWLWQRFVADNLKNFGPVERAHVYSFLNNGRDITYNWSVAGIGGIQQDSHLTADELTEGNLKEYFETQSQVCFYTDTEEERKRLATHIGQAVNFIATTPYMYFQEGRHAAP